MEGQIRGTRQRNWMEGQIRRIRQREGNDGWEGGRDKKDGTEGQDGGSDQRMGQRDRMERWDGGTGQTEGWVYFQSVSSSKMSGLENHPRITPGHLTWAAPVSCSHMPMYWQGPSAPGPAILHSLIGLRGPMVTSGSVRPARSSGSASSAAYRVGL